jgi:hypothetical protein
MSNSQATINKLVDQFVTQITGVAREAAAQALNTAFQAQRGRAGKAKPGKVPSGPRAKGAKRPSSEINGTMDEIANFIARHPGLRIEQINDELGTSTKDLALPLRKLVRAGRVRVEGEKRATRYFAGEK